MRWPFVRRSTYDALKLENFTLRDALMNANAELRRHRTLLGGLRDGEKKVTEQLQRIFRNDHLNGS